MFFSLSQRIALHTKTHYLASSLWLFCLPTKTILPPHFDYLASPLRLSCPPVQYHWHGKRHRTAAWNAVFHVETTISLLSHHLLLPFRQNRNVKPPAQILCQESVITPSGWYFLDIRPPSPPPPCRWFLTTTETTMTTVRTGATLNVTKRHTTTTTSMVAECISVVSVVVSPRDTSSYYTCCLRFFLKSGDSMARSRKKSHFPPYYRHFLAKRTLVQMFITQLLPTWIKAKILGCTFWCTQNGTVPDLLRLLFRSKYIDQHAL